MDQDRRGVEALIAAENAAWNRSDAAAFAEPVLEDCVFTNIFGQAFAGREAFERQHAAIFSTIYTDSRVSQTIEHLRFLKPDVAVVDTSAELHVPAGPQGAARTVSTKLLQVLVLRERRWRVAAYHNVEVRPPPGGP